MNKDKFLVKDGNRAEWGVPEGYPYKEGEAYKITLPDDLSACENASEYWYKVSDLTPAVSEVEEGQIVINSSEYGAETYIIKNIIINSDENGYVLGEGHVIVALVPNYSFMGMTCPDAGIYFYAIEGNVWVTEMVWSNETIHPMSAEFLPTETWTFTLDDGSTVTKKVAVGE